MSQVGRISGPLLEANLERNGIDLAFRNDLDTTQLLFLDVNNGRIGVNTGTPTRDLEVNGTLQTVNLLTGDSRVAGFDIANSTFSAIGNIELSATEAVVLPALDNGTVFIDGNYISTRQSNASIDITPNGTGKVQIINDLNVYGNLYTPGNITLEGTITFGNQNTDAVDFNADVDSDIIPDQSSVYSLGSTTKRWQTLYTNLLNGQAVSVDDLTVGLIDYNKSQGNIIYVAQNGTDTNRGDHILAPVASIKRALELVDASVGAPTVVLVFPGEYEEETPLVIPSNVSVIGTDIRNTSVFPTSYTQSEDVFHLNGETTVANLTVKNFYYDSNKGYAFRFAPNAVISTRSPYVQNITVITKGSNTTIDDPRGFDTGDAGRGAYIDGSELNSASIDASMLFHSCTFITPGVDAIVMTNGVRVEWLNSFTYFANRGLYAFNNSTGRVSNDGSTINYGAEVRSIGSANVYGNYGAVADGADTLMYLIQHNFAYIGSGKESSNDEGLVIQANEVVEENGGRIQYVTTDHTGAFRIGDNFFVDFESGTTSVDLSTLTANSLSGLVVTTGADQTFITGSKIETGNIRISDNIIESLADELNIDASTDEINFNNNTNISNNLSIDGNLSFGGNLNLLGNQTSDTLKFNVDFDQNFNPNQTLRFSLGVPSKQWLMAHLSEINVSDIKIYDNVIETKTSNADLELRANGTGNVSIPNNNVSISNSLTIDQTSSFDNVTVSGPVSVTATMTLNNDVSARNITVGQSISIDQQATFEGIVIDDNYISTIASNADLELRASGTGSIVVPNNNITINNNLSADNIETTGDIEVTVQTQFDTAQVSSVTLDNNIISTTGVDVDLQLGATGNVTVPSNNVAVSNDLTVLGSTSLQDTTITGTLTQTGSRTQTGSYSQTGNLSMTGVLDVASAVQLENININDNVISTTQTNSDLDLRASGTGSVLVPNNNVRVNNNLFASSIIAGNINVDSDLVLNEIVIPPSIIEIDDNFISTRVSNADLDLRATGNVTVPNNNVIVEQNLVVTETTNLKNTLIVGTVSHTGDTTYAGNKTQTGDLTVNGVTNFTSAVAFEDIQIVGNVLTTTQSNSNLELNSNGTGVVLIDNNNVVVTRDVSVGSLSSSNIIINNSFALELMESSTDVQIFDNVITTTNSNSNLELRTSGSGDIVLENLFVNTNTISTQSSNIVLTAPNLNINSTGSLQIPVGTSELVTQGAIKFDSATGLFEGRNNSVVTLSGVYSSDRRTSLTAHPTNNTLSLTVNNVVIGTVAAAGLTIHGLQIDDIGFQTNTISTTVSNSNLELVTPGTGELIIDDVSIIDNTIKNNSSGALTFATTGLGRVKFNDVNGLVVPYGTTAEQPVADPELGDTRWNTDTELLETWDGNQYITSAGVATAISEEEYNDLLLEYTLIFG